MRRSAVTGTVWTSLIASQSPCRLMDGITRLFRCVLGTLSENGSNTIDPCSLNVAMLHVPLFAYGGSGRLHV